MKNIVIAAGYATRLGKLTKNFPKPLLKIGNNTILGRMLDDIDNISDIDEHIIITNHKFAAIFEKWAEEQHYRNPITIIDDGTETNEKRLGAVCDLLFAIEKLNIRDDILVVAADNLLFFSFQDFIDFAKEKGTSCIMYHKQPNIEKLQRTGVIVIDGNMKVMEMEEKPEQPKSHLAVPPFYIYIKKDLDFIRHSINNGCRNDAPGYLTHYMVKHTTIHAWPMTEGRFDIGSLDTYNEARKKYGKNMKLNMKHISITGSIGSGKSVLSNKLSKLLGMEIESAGSIQRKIAKQFGMTTNQFNKYMEKHPEFDTELDNFIKNAGESNNPKIFDSRLAWHFVPNSLKIYLYVNEQIAANRIYADNHRINENYKTVDECLYYIRKRRESEVQRYRKKYNLDLEQLSNYDVILDTGFTSTKENAEMIKNIYANPLYNKLWLSPFSVKPTTSIREYSLSANTCQPYFISVNDYLDNPVKVLFYRNEFYIYDGHKRVINAIRNNMQFIPCELKNKEKGFMLFKSQTVEDYIKDNYSENKEKDWIDYINVITQQD